MNELRCSVLIIEDGDEYLDNLTRYVPGPRYLQAHHGEAAATLLAEAQVDLLYLDMRFDRIAPEQLWGDLAALTQKYAGNARRAQRHLANHQGTYILDGLHQRGLADLPIILAYDFSREQRRFEQLLRRYAQLTWVPDAVTPEEIRDRIRRLAGAR